MSETLALVGPTASGKTRISLELAPRFDAEILAVDSMTIYRGMDVGTAKPTVEERAQVPHHLIDVAEPLDRFTVAAFQRLARTALAGVLERGKRPMVVGGSGLYFRAVVDELAFPPTDPAVRARLEQEDVATLAVRLKEKDPVAAETVDLRNKRRVVRALEVIEITGRLFSAFREDWERHNPVIVAGLEVSAPELDRRIRARIDAMLTAGLLGEVGVLLERGYREALTASQAIGYREAVRLMTGELDEAGFRDEAARATKRLARRQMSWFRRDPRVRWFPADELARAAEEVGAYYERRIRGESG